MAINYILYRRLFLDVGVIQCGFCMPGMILATKSLLDANPEPNLHDIFLALKCHYCRYIGCVQIIEAVQLADS